MESKPETSRQSLKEINSRHKKRLKRTVFTLNEKQMVLNVHKYVEQTWPDDEYPYKTSIMEKTATILGIGVASVYRIIKEYDTNGEVKSPTAPKKRLTCVEKIDEVVKEGIQNKVYSILLRGESPTLKNVLQAVNEDEELPNYKRSTFQKILKHLKVKHIKYKSSTPNKDDDDDD